jgi:Cu/Ag efflux protein CusF
MPSRALATWTILAVVFAVAVGFNFPWEILQARLYRMETGRLPVWLHCFRASLGDGLLVLFILVSGAGIMQGLDWFRRPGLRGYAWMLASGLTLSVIVEWIAVHVLNLWSYTPAMPLLPGLRIGLVPIAQMLMLPPAIFAVAARVLPERGAPKGGVMKSKLCLIVVGILLLAVACAQKEQAPAAGGEPTVTPPAGVEKTYPLRGKIVSRDPTGNEITVDHEKVEGLWEPMTMAFEVRGAEPGSLPAEGSTIRATLHVQDGRYWLTDVTSE